MPRIAIKGQVIPNFLVEFTYPTKALEMTTDTSSTLGGLKRDDKPTNPNNVWSLRIDGSSNVNENSTGVILES